MSKMSAGRESQETRCPKPASKLTISIAEEDLCPPPPASVSTRNQPFRLISNPPVCTRPDINSPKTRVLIQFAEGRNRPRPPLEPKTCMARAPHRYVFSTKSNEGVMTKGRVMRKPATVSSQTALSALVSAVPPFSQPKSNLHQTYLALNFIKHLPAVDSDQLRSRMVLLSRPTTSPKKTLIFDLDETLVHCVADITQAEVVIPVRFPSGETVCAGVNIRPYAKECLAAANQTFEVMVFTASQQCYADRVLDYLDPSNQLIHHRLYRDSCLPHQGLYIKDLRILANRRLQDIVIVDNAAYSFAYQLDNGVPILPWFDDRSDRELQHLMQYMRVWGSVEDVRAVNRKLFRLYSFCEEYRKEFEEDKENATS